MRILLSKSIPILLILFSMISCNENQPSVPTKLQGMVFGTSYQINYFDSHQRNFTKTIDSLFYLINKSLSTYILTSDISKINNGDVSVNVDDYFKEVFQKSSKIYIETQGVFDPTIGVLVNAWGFGPEDHLKELDSTKVKKLMKLVGFSKVKLQDNKILKENDSIYFDFNAVAKGYAVDVVSRFLEAEKISNYLVEIGGEVRSNGINKTKNKLWKVGIESPNFDGSRSLERAIELNNEAMATSGNYRKFKIDSITGNKYAHIINTKTGYPVQNNLLSVSIIASYDCADVDAYATAIMAMSLKKAKNFLENKDQLKAFIIYSDDKGEIKTFATSNF